MTKLPKTISFGWGAEPFKQQIPALSDDMAEALDADNKAIVRLHLRGVMSDGERDKAIRRVTRQIDRWATSPAGLAALSSPASVKE